MMVKSVPWDMRKIELREILRGHYDAVLSASLSQARPVRERLQFLEFPIRALACVHSHKTSCLPRTDVLALQSDLMK